MARHQRRRKKQDESSSESETSSDSSEETTDSSEDGATSSAESSSSEESSSESSSEDSSTDESTDSDNSRERRKGSRRRRSSSRKSHERQRGSAVNGSHRRSARRSSSKRRSGEERAQASHRRKSQRESSSGRDHSNHLTKSLLKAPTSRWEDVDGNGSQLSTGSHTHGVSAPPRPASASRSSTTTPEEARSANGYSSPVPESKQVEMQPLHPEPDSLTNGVSVPAPLGVSGKHTEQAAGESESDEETNVKGRRSGVFKEIRNASGYPYRRHTSALIRKSLTYQKKNKCTNCCQITVPLFFLGLLFLMQTLINSSLSGNLEEQDIDPAPRPAAFWVPAWNGTVQGADVQLLMARPDTLAAEASNFSMGIGPSSSLSTFDGGNPVIFPWMAWRYLEKQRQEEEDNQFGANRYWDFTFERGVIFRDCGSTDFITANRSWYGDNPLLPSLRTMLYTRYDEGSGNNYTNNAAFEWQNSYDPCQNAPNGKCYLYCYNFNGTVYSSRLEVDDEIMRVWETKTPSLKTGVTGGISINALNKGTHTYSMAVMYNETFTAGQDLPALMNMAASATSKYALDQTYNMMLVTVGNLPTPGLPPSIDAAAILGGFFYMMVLQLLFPVMLGQLVYEKEHRLREIMKMMGLRMPVYWAATYLFNFLLVGTSMTVIFILGWSFDFSFFRTNAFWIVALFLFLWGNNMIAFSFFASNLFKKHKTAAISSYLWVFGSTIISQTLMQTFIQADPESSSVFFMTFVPPLALYRGLYTLSDEAAYDYGLETSEFAASAMPEVFLVLGVGWIVFMVLAIYIDCVIPSGPGVAKHPLFFLGFTFKPDAVEPKERQGPRVAADGSAEVLDESSGVPFDVLAEVKRVRKEQDTDIISIKKLRKVYRGEDGQPDFEAVRRLDLGVKDGECFGLLGPNGAGKTTVINMLCGFHPPTSGSAFVAGYSIRTDIESIHQNLGICPQHDILWGTLTSREHLTFYGRLKNIPEEKLQTEVERALDSVKLLHVADSPCQTYSGGMKRRLSVAISLIGSPRVVIMDEPSTGLDPASRRQLWEVIKTHKKNKGMILTTHSMEEADLLCDRIGIFVRGDLRAIGNPKELKTRFGAFFRFVVLAPSKRHKDVHSFILEIAPTAKRTDRISGVMKYQIPRKDINIADFFERMEAQRDSLGIEDWGLSNTTLEDAFLRVAMQN